MKFTLPKLILIAMSWCISTMSLADEITLLATMGGKAIFQVNGQKKSLLVGQKQGDFKVISIATDSAIVESSNGRQRRLGLGEGYVAVSATQTDGDGSLVLSPGQGGHYFADVVINGQSQRGVIDTGATHLSMTSKMADSLNVNYKNGRPTMSQTANGLMKGWHTQVPQLKLGSVTLYNVDVGVRESNETGPTLIGMSTLNRFQMKREQDLMILSKKNY